MTVRMSSIFTTRKKLLYSLWPTRVGESHVARVSDHDVWTRAQLSLESGFVVRSLNSWRALGLERKSLFFCPNRFLRNKLRPCFYVATLRWRWPPAFLYLWSQFHFTTWPLRVVSNGRPMGSLVWSTLRLTSTLCTAKGYRRRMWKVFQGHQGGVGGHGSDYKNAQVLLINFVGRNLSSSKTQERKIDTSTKDESDEKKTMMTHIQEHTGSSSAPEKPPAHWCPWFDPLLTYACTSRKLVEVTRKLFHIASRLFGPTIRTLHEISGNFDCNSMADWTQVHEWWHQ